MKRYRRIEVKKVFLLLISMFCLVGCTKINTENYDEIFNNAISLEIDNTNIKRSGYNYYLPDGIKIMDSKEYNEILKQGNYQYYLYVDLVSYYNKEDFSYEKNDSYYSQIYGKSDKKGYLEINYEQNDKYLIEIMYNYAKIEVIVDKKDINKAITYAISILSSITYNDSVIANLLGDDVLNFSEEEFNIFKTVGKDSNILKYNEQQTTTEEETPDTDLVN